MSKSIDKKPLPPLEHGMRVRLKRKSFFGFEGPGTVISYEPSGAGVVVIEPDGQDHHFVTVRSDVIILKDQSPYGAHPVAAFLPYELLADVRLTPNDKVILLVLQKWGWQTMECSASDQAIADSAAMTIKDTRASLDRLVNLGLIREEDAT